MTASPTYLVKQASSPVYYFRIRVPEELVSQVGRKELRCSLRTGYLREAKRSANRLAAWSQHLFLKLKAGKMPEVTKQQIPQLISQYFERLLQEDEEGRTRRSKPLQTIERDEIVQTCSLLIADIKESLSLSDLSQANLYVDNTAVSQVVKNKA